MITQDIMEDFEFGDVKPSQADEAADAEQICFPPNEACSREDMKKRIAKAPQFFLTACDKSSGRIAGYICGIATNEKSLRDEMFKDISLHDEAGKNVMILGVGVLPEYRRRGLASVMMTRYLDRERKRGRKNVVLTCLEDKVKMYEGMGYEDLGMSQSVWGGEQWHEMVCRLSPC